MEPRGEAFRGRSYLAPLYELCPELVRSAPGAFRSDRFPELRAVVSVDERCHDGVDNLARFRGQSVRTLENVQGEKLTARGYAPEIRN